MFGGVEWQSPSEPDFCMAVGSAMVTLVVQPFGEDGAFIISNAWVVTGAENSEELYRFLLAANVDMRCGGFGVDADGDIIYQYGIIASSLSKEELRAAVIAVAQTANEYDNQIVATYGGMTVKDRMKTPS